MLNFIKNILRKNKMKKELPPKGSFYVHNKIGSAYNGMCGIVGHHGCGERFYIKLADNRGTLCSIKP